MGEQERQTRQDRAGSSAHPGCPEGARRRCPGTAQAVPGDRAGILRRLEAELHPRLTESPIHRPGTDVLLSIGGQKPMSDTTGSSGTRFRAELDDGGAIEAAGSTVLDRRSGEECPAIVIRMP